MAEDPVPGETGTDTSVPLVLDSLQRRMRALFSLYEDAVATMDLDQVNHFEREGVLPIAFSLFHIVNMIDASFLLMTGTPPVWDDSWVARVHPAIADHGKHRTVAEMVHQRIGDYDEFQAYMGVVFARVEAWLADLDPAELTRLVIARPVPRPDRQHLQRPGGGARGHHAPRRRPSAGSTSTGCATWGRSNWPAAWSAWAA